MSFTTLALLAGLATAVAAIPAPISKGHDLVAALERRQPGGLYSIEPELSSGAEIYNTTWPDFANATSRWSTYSAPTFNLLFVPTTEEDISVALAYLTSNGVPFLAQGGGHGYSPTLGVIQNAVQINMENFNSITFNANDTMTIGGSVRFGDIYDAAYAAGREFTLGSCPCVGATGATLGGGHGRLQGKWGLSGDAVLSMRIVLGNGTIVTASADENADLFWGMRGAGQNFGVVVSTTFQTYPTDTDGLHYNADMVFTGDSLEGVFAAVNKLIPNQDPALAMDILFFANTTTLESVLYINLVYAGPQEQGEVYANYFATTSNGTNATALGSIDRVSINATLLTFAELPYLSAGGAIAAACAKGYRQNTYSVNNAEFNIAETRALYDSYQAFVKANPDGAASLILFEVFGQQGVVANANLSAAANRDYSNVLGVFEMIYTSEEDGVAQAADGWAKGWRDNFAQTNVSGYDRLYVYQNYAHGDEPLQAIYGYEAYREEKLVALKNTYDPTNSFDGYHNVPLSGF